SGKTQSAIGRVFEQVNRVSGVALEFFQQFQDAVFLFEAGRDAGGILKVADEVNHFDAPQFAGAFERLQNAFQMREVEAVALEPHGTRAQTAALEDAQINKIGRVFNEHDVALVAQRFRRHVEQLLRTAGDEQAFERIYFGRDGVPPSLIFGTPTRRPSQI